MIGSLRKAFAALAILGAAAPAPGTVDVARQAKELLQEADGYYSGNAGEVDQERARRLFLEAAELGDPVAELRLATLYQLGACGFEKNPLRANRLARRAYDAALARAERGDAEAQFCIGSVLLLGVGRPREPARAVKWYVRAAEDQPWAAHNLGWMYRSGVGVEPDQELALTWYKRAAAVDIAAAMYEVGVAHIRGRGTQRDPDTGLRWLRAASQERHRAAMSYLGNLLLFGNEGVKIDVDEGRQWLELAAEMGDPHASYGLGYARLRGIGLKPDDQQAAGWFLRGAELGHADSANYLGTLYLEGRGVPEDPHQALAWLEKALIQGLDRAYDNLLLLSDHEGLSDEDRRRFVARLEKQAAGSVDAKAFLSMLLSEGWFGVRRDQERAFELARTAAEAGSPRGMGLVGFAHQNGRGTTQSHRLAVAWYRRGAEAGDRYSMLWLGRSHLNGEGVPKDVQEGLRWLERAAGEGRRLLWAILDLARIYDHGLYGLPEDLHRAAVWYQLAVEQGSEEASDWLRLHELAGD
jgi:TPR repeat protein